MAKRLSSESSIHADSKRLKPEKKCVLQCCSSDTSFSLNLDEFTELCDPKPLNTVWTVVLAIIKFRSLVRNTLFLHKDAAHPDGSWVRNFRVVQHSGCHVPKPYRTGDVRINRENKVSRFTGERWRKFKLPTDATVRVSSIQMLFVHKTQAIPIASWTKPMVKVQYGGTQIPKHYTLQQGDVRVSKKGVQSRYDGSHWQSWNPRVLSFDRSFASHEKSKYWSIQNEQEPVEVAKHCNLPFWFDCPECAHTFKKPLNAVCLGGWCPYCIQSSSWTHCGVDNCQHCFKRSFASHPKASSWSKKNRQSAKEVCISSGKPYLFDCDSCSHTFELKPCDVVRGYWCTYCAHKKMCHPRDSCDYCFQASFQSFEGMTDLNKRKIECWDVDANQGLLPSMVFKGSHSKYWFACDCCSHKFESSLQHVASGKWCPYCAHLKLCLDKECTVCLANSFAGFEGKTPTGLLKRDCWNDEKNGLNTPFTTFRNTCSKRWFDCEVCSHVFEMSMHNVSRGQWCPHCKHKSEQMLREFAQQVYGTNCIISGRVEWCKNPMTGRCFPFDMIVSTKRVILECDGDQHLHPVSYFNQTLSFEDICQRDRFKEGKAIENGYSVIRVLQSDIRFNQNDWRRRVIDAISSLFIEKPRVVKLY